MRYNKLFVFKGLFGLSSVASNVWAAIIAIVVLHVLLGMYIYRAYNTDTTKTKPDKLD